MGRTINIDKIIWNPFKKRIGDIGIRNFYMDEDIPKPVGLRKTFNHFEVVKYSPNPYYGREGEYEWDEHSQVYRVNNSHSINPSCFKNPETCYVLAYWVDIDHDERTPDLKFVGSRPMELNESELKAFWDCVKIGQKHIEDVLDKFDEDEY